MSCFLRHVDCQMSTEQFLLIPSKSAVCKDGMESGVAEPGRHPGITKTAQTDRSTNQHSS